MPEIRALIVDDEPLARRGIRQLLAREPDMVVVGECRDGRDALAALDTLVPDLVFLDVQMPELDAFGIIKARGVDRMPIVVFVTAYDAFAVKAFEAQALDYLVKPLVAARFAATMTRVRERVRERRRGVRALWRRRWVPPRAGRRSPTRSCGRACAPARNRWRTRRWACSPTSR